MARTQRAKWADKLEVPQRRRFGRRLSSTVAVIDSQNSKCTITISRAGRALKPAISQDAMPFLLKAAIFYII
jgi:hypothetical protein